MKITPGCEIFPCRDCQDRRTGCHAVCRKYLDAREEHTRELKRYQKEKERDRLIKDFKDQSFRQEDW